MSKFFMVIAMVLVLTLAAPVAAQPPYNPYGGYGYGGGYYGGGYGYGGFGGGYGYQSRTGEILGGVAQIIAVSRIGRAEREAARGQYYGPEAQAKADRIRAMTAQEQQVSDAVADRTWAGANLSYQGGVGADGSSVRELQVSGGAAVAPRRYRVVYDAAARRAAYGRAMLQALDRLQGRPSGGSGRPRPVKAVADEEGP